MSLLDEHGHALLRLLEEDHALGDPPREDVVSDGAALEHLAVDDLVGLAQVAQDDAAVARVPRVDDVEHVEHLGMKGKVYVVSWVTQLKRLREHSMYPKWVSRWSGSKIRKIRGTSQVLTAHLFAHFLYLGDLLFVVLGDVVAAEDDDVPLEEHEQVVVAVQEHAELAVQLPEARQLARLVLLRQGLQLACDAKK